MTPFNIEDFLLALAVLSEQRGLSIAWCAEFGMPEVAAKTVKDVFGLHEFRCGMQRRMNQGANECGEGLLLPTRK